MDEKYILLSNSCKLGKGYVRSCIYDIIRNDLFLIPNSLTNLIETDSHLTIGEIKKKFENQDEIINDYISFFTRK